MWLSPRLQENYLALYPRTRARDSRLALVWRASLRQLSNGRGAANGGELRQAGRVAAEALSRWPVSRRAAKLDVVWPCASGGNKMARCRQCNLLISGAAEHCPRCGIPLPARFHFSARGIVVAGILIVVLFAAVWRGGGPVSTSSDEEFVQDNGDRYRVDMSSVTLTQGDFLVGIQSRGLWRRQKRRCLIHSR